MSWHVSTEILLAYRDGTLASSEAWSVEAHVTSCDVCRIEVIEGVDGGRLEAIWAGISDETSLSRRPVLEGLMVRLGVPDHIARLLGATPSLTVPWLAAVAAAIGFAIAMAWTTGVDPANPQRVLLPFLVMAPLIPLAGVAAAFGPLVDPAYEIAVAAPINGARLLLVRSVAVISTSMLLVACGAVLLPDAGWLAVAWILPALALTTVALALSTLLPTHAAIALPALVWVMGIFALESGSTRVAGFGVRTQLLMATVLAAAIAVALVRRRAFDIDSQL